MKIMIVRHCDPDYSIDSLTPQGWIEVEALKDRLSKLDIKAFYCSPLGRARDTAAPTLKALGAEAEICPWLREFWPNVKRPDTDEGIAWDWLPQTWTAWPDFYDKDRWTDHPLFLDAKVKEAAQEAQAGLDAVLERHGYVRQGNLYRADQANEDTIVFFCHFGIECVLLGHLLGISPMVLWHSACALPSSVTTLVTEERRKGTASFRMTGFGDLSHLYAAGITPSFAARFCETYDTPGQRRD